MERNFNREFEEFIKSTADQYRMIPTEKVWKGINSSLHTRRKWYGFGLALLLLLTAVSVTWVMVSNPTSKKQEIASQQVPPAIVPEQPVSQSQLKSGSVPKDISTILPFSKFSSPRNESTIATSTEIAEMPVVIVPDATSAHVSATTMIDQATEEKNSSSSVLSRQINILADPASGNVAGIGDPLLDFKKIEKVTQPQPLLVDTRPGRSHSMANPFTIESVLNSYKAKKIAKKLSWQIYFTPTVSYRKLSVNKSYEGNGSPFSANNFPFANSSDINSQVTHKPDMGLELGLSTKYPLSKNLKLTGAFQFNISRYDIKAFAYFGEEATINLNGGDGTNSVRAWTYYRNHSGYKADWLKNYYFSVSAPVGAELRLLGNDKTYLGVAGTVQPTYIIKDKAFLISTDYKNYVEVPRLIRHWNINTSLETFISYTSRSARTRWQIGPQVRYQVLSSFKNKYPVNENLFDFGLKVGISRNNP